MSRKVQTVCEACNALFYVNRYDDYHKCPRCGWITDDVFSDGFDDRRDEDAQ